MNPKLPIQLSDADYTVFGLLVLIGFAVCGIWILIEEIKEWNIRRKA